MLLTFRQRQVERFQIARAAANGGSLQLKTRFTIFAIAASKRGGQYDHQLHSKEHTDMDMDMFLWAAPDRKIERRIDITFSRVANAIDIMSDAERGELVGKPWFAAVCLLQRVRAMERGEEHILGHPIEGGIADTYDAVVRPGDDIIPALLKTFQALLK